jgi:hypothetical protein
MICIGIKQREPKNSRRRRVIMFTIAEPGKIWVWTPLTESIYPDRKAGEPVWERLRCSIYKSWADNGWVEPKAVDDVFETPLIKPSYEELEEKIKELKQELEVHKKALEPLSEYAENCPSDYSLITCNCSLPEKCDCENSVCWHKWSLDKARKELAK